MRVLSIQTTVRADSLCLPLVISPIAAGFPSPAEDHLQEPLNLHDLMVQREEATFCFRVKGDSMQPCGIFSGDLIVVDKSILPVDDAVVVAVLENQFTVKRYRKSRGRIWLVADNSDYAPIIITEGMNFEVWGVVTYVVHGLLP